MRYEEYKETGYSWFGNIPAHWNLYRNGLLFTTHQIKVGENFSEYDLLSLTTTGVKVKSIEDVKGKVPASYESYQEVREGDIVFCLFDLDCSAVFSGISKYKGMITSAYDVVKPNNELANSRFLDYWFQFVFSGRYYKIYSKSVRYTINYDIFKMLKTPIPPRKKQDQIVKYLDWQVSKINKLIAAKKRKIKLLNEYKQSIIQTVVFHGIEFSQEKDCEIGWINKIPASWNTLRIKNLFSMRDERNHSPLSDVNLLSLYASLGVVQNCDVEYKTGNRARTAENYKKVEKDDIVVNIILCWMGAVGRSKYSGVVSPAYDVYVPNKGVCSRYYHYLFRLPVFSSECKKVGHGIMEMRWRTYSPEFRSIYVPVPSYDEQIKIADWIEEHTKGTDEIIEKLDSQIKVLQETKNKLISDVVTGQMDVRGIEIPKYEYFEDSAEEEPDEDSEEVTEEEEE